MEKESRADILAKREAKKQAKKSKKEKSSDQSVSQPPIAATNKDVVSKIEKTDGKKEPVKTEKIVESKASAASHVEKTIAAETTARSSGANAAKPKIPKQCDWFGTLSVRDDNCGFFSIEPVVSQSTNFPIHRDFLKMNLLTANRRLSGSTRCAYAFLNATLACIDEFQTTLESKLPADRYEILKNFDILKITSYFNDCLRLLKTVRNVSISVENIVGFIERKLLSIETKVDGLPEKLNQLSIDLREFQKSNFEKAIEIISSKLVTKINNGFKILVYGNSSVVGDCLIAAAKSKLDFQVFVVDSWPLFEGKHLLKKLTAYDINCSYALLSSVSCLMPRMDLVLVGASAVLVNGDTLSRAGTAQLAFVANSCQVPFFVCCESFKFSSRFVENSLTLNETYKNVERSEKTLALMYDLTPARFVTGIFSELGIIPAYNVLFWIRKINYF